MFVLLCSSTPRPNSVKRNRSDSEVARDLDRELNNTTTTTASNFNHTTLNCNISSSPRQRSDSDIARAMQMEWENESANGNIVPSVNANSVQNDVVERRMHRSDR
jgi:hypothetical protein